MNAVTSDATHALVVGISAYSEAGLTDLPACEGEARSIADALASPQACGLPPSNIKLIDDASASRARIVDALKALASQAAASDVIIFYFAGHGEADEVGFILRTGPRGADPERGIRREDIVEALAGTQAGGVLVILDCCGGAGFAERAPDFFFGLAGHDFRLLVSASRAGQSSWELPDRGSLFTRRLLKALRGEDGVSDSGQIYFNDLFEYLHDGVVEDARQQLWDGAQEPVFVGARAGEPLLFVNRDLNLAKVRVRKRRITRDVLRRRVIATAAAVVVAIGLSVAGYWAFMDSHQFIVERGEALVLIHGYPGLSGFGLPQDEWIYSAGPQDLATEYPPARGRPMVFDRETSPEDMLAHVLRPAARAGLSLWANKPNEALADLLSVAHEHPSAESADLEFLPSLVSAVDGPQLMALAKSLPPNASLQAVIALQRIDPSVAIHAFLASPAAGNFGMQLDLLSKWEGPCTSAVQAWLDERLADRNTALAFAQTVQTIVRVRGCVVGSERALSADEQHIRDAVYGLRLTNPSGWQDIRQVLGGMLGNPSSAIHEHSKLFNRLAVYWRHSGGGPCAGWLLDAPEVVTDALMDAGIAAARDCPGYRLSAELPPNGFDLVATASSGKRYELAHLDFDGNLGANALRPVDAMLEVGAGGREPALRAILSATDNADLRMYVARKLRYLEADGSAALSYRLPNRPDLDRELVRWLARSDPGRASQQCAALIIGGDVDSKLLEVLALIAVADADKAKLLSFAGTLGNIPRTMIVTLLAPALQAAQLLVEPDPKVRGFAQEYVLAREDAPAVIAEAWKSSVHADVGLVRAGAHLRRIDVLRAELASMPDFALSWRAQSMDHTEIVDHGSSLAFERLLDHERGRALAFP